MLVMRTLRTTIALAVAASLLVLAAPPASAAGPIDQQQPSFAAGCLPVSAGGLAQYAQTFTAGRTGTLDQVDHFLARVDANDPTPFQLQVFGVAADGSPAEPALTSATVPAASVPVRTFDPRVEGSWVTFSIPPIPVVAGEHYAVVVTRGAAPWFLCGDNTNPYPGGSAWGRGGESDGSWYPWSDLSSIGYDWAFRTYVTDANPLQPVLGGVTAVVQNLVCALQALLGAPCA